MVQHQITNNEVFIDATNTILGRLASFAAKQALLGINVNIVNCEKAVISGSKKFTLTKYLQKRKRGTPNYGPFFPRLPEDILKRTIRGMLPWKQAKGREAYKRIKCYLAVPKSLDEKAFIRLEAAHFSKLPTTKYTTLKKLSTQLGR